MNAERPRRPGQPPGRRGRSASRTTAWPLTADARRLRRRLV